MADPLLPGLRDELVAAARRTSRRRNRRRTTLGVAAVAAAFVALLATLVLADSDPAAAGVEITIHDGVIEVRLTDLESRPEVVERALREAGLDADVTTAAVGPSNLGRFVGIASLVTEELQPLDASGETFPGFLVPESYDGRLELQIGRRAESGELYAVTSDAYAPGEPLSCLEVYGTEGRDVLARLDADLDVRFLVHEAGSPIGPPMTREAFEASEFVSYRAVDALALSSREVVINVTRDGTSPFLTPVSPDQGRCRE